MELATCETGVSTNSEPSPEANQAIVLQRLCSSVMLLLSGAAAFVSGGWTDTAALLAACASIVATCFHRRWSGPSWAAFTTVGFMLWAWRQI
jgi:hypothetical protein